MFSKKKGKKQRKKSMQFSQFEQFWLSQTYRDTLWLCVIESDCETVEIYKVGSKIVIYLKLFRLKVMFI